MSPNVLVLGGGVAGNVVATELRRLLPSAHRIVVVERSDRFVLGASLLRIVLGEARPEDVTRPIAALSRRSIEVVTGEVERIDPVARRVRIGAQDIGADRLVVALGADLDLAGVPGLREAGHSFYSLEGAVALRDALARFDGGRIVVLTAAPAYKCPAAPYEMAMLIEWSLRRRGVRERSVIDLYAAEPAPMGVAGPTVSAAVRGLLGAKDIAYHPDHQIVRADAATRHLQFANGASAPYDLLAYVAPHRAPRAVRESGLTGESGWVPVDRATLRTRFERVWAIGDVTGIPLKVGKPLPKAATFARGEGEVVARAIVADVKGGEPARAYAAMGECWVETGDGMAAYGHGDFFGDPAPVVSLEAPSPEAHRAKEAWEREWLERWA